jgi:hypothetical protein
MLEDRILCDRRQSVNMKKGKGGKGGGFWREEGGGGWEVWRSGGRKRRGMEE